MVVELEDAIHLVYKKSQSLNNFWFDLKAIALSKKKMGH